MKFSSQRSATAPVFVRHGRWAAVLTAGAAVVAVLTPGSAKADTVIPLPDQHRVFNSAIGIPVDLSETGNSATVSPAIAANGLSRTAWVTGTAFATMPGAKTGTLETGFLVGCQVDLSGGVSAGGDVYIDASDLDPEATASFALKPGQVAAVKLGSKDLAPAAGRVGIGFQNAGIQVDSCAGYAQARSYTNLKVTNSRGSTVVSLYGQPFSLG